MSRLETEDNKFSREDFAYPRILTSPRVFSPLGKQNLFLRNQIFNYCPSHELEGSSFKRKVQEIVSIDVDFCF